eukprot:GHVT01081689.1.p1 GENE.GHVT01081689.1~~GHVT01081689.1.p1  ORF type:complete len:133 (-),score=2.88 GHVT01081689.1:381-779(-)
MSANDKIDLYKSLVRTIVEYACPVWHPGLTKYLEHSLETIQRRVLLSVFPDMAYKDALSKADLPSLDEHRDQLTQDLFSQMENPNKKCHNLLPEIKIKYHNTRNQCKCCIPKARTNSYKNSFVPWCVNKMLK